MRVPCVEIMPMGRHLDLVSRHHQAPEPEKKMDTEVDEMGELRERVHIGKQD